MRAVGEFHEKDADILAHRQKKLSEILGLRAAGQGLDGKPAEFCHTVDKLGDIAAKLIIKRIKGHIAIFDSVVKKRGDDALLVEPHIGEDIGHRDRMCEIGFSRRPCLAIMRLTPEIKARARRSASTAAS